MRPYKKLAIGTTCRNGHVMTNDTLYITKNGRNYCWLCNCVSRKKYMDKLLSDPIRGEAFREHQKKKSKEYFATHKNIPERKIAQKNRRLLYKYGIDLDTYNNMLDSQDKKCVICKQKLFLYVDHDHSTGKVRGLLCGQCNMGLGAFKDNIMTLQNAIDYLLSTNSQ